MTRAALSLLLLFFLQAFAAAESALRWESKQLEFRPAATEKAVRAEFEFTNAGNEPVTIDSVLASCGCTTVALEKKVFQPGEHGQITALFTIGQRKGLQAKGIRVVIRGEPDPVNLMMVTHVAESIRIEPQFVVWKFGEEPRPKVISLAIPRDSRLRLTRVSSSDPRIGAALESTRAGNEYRLIVTPGGSEATGVAVLRIEAVSPSNTTQTFQAYAQIKGTAPSGSRR